MFKTTNGFTSKTKLSKTVSKFNKVILASEDRRLTRTHLKFDIQINNRNKKYSNTEQLFYDPGISETRASFRIPDEPKEIERNISSNSSKIKQVSFIDQRRAPKPVNMNRGNENVVINSMCTPILKRKESEKQLIYILKGISSIETPNSPAPLLNQFARLSEMSSEPKDVLFTVDMAGFDSHNIKFYSKGRRLIIEGTRPKNHPFIRSRRTQEIIHLPPGILCDNFRIARTDEGALIFEEAWKF